MTQSSSLLAFTPARRRFSRLADGIRQEWVRTFVSFAAVAAIGWLVLYPMAMLFDIGMRDEDGALTLANYRSVFTEPGLSDALINSLVVSVAVTIFSLAIALPMAWAVSRTAMPGGRFFRIMAMVAFVIPNFIAAIAWILLLSPNAGFLNVVFDGLTGLGPFFNIYTPSGLVLILTCSSYPLIFFAAAAALDNMDPAYEEAAQMSGASSWRGSLQITIPLILPAILSSSTFVFLEALGAFGAPAAIANAARFQTLTTRIYEMFTYPPRFELAAAAAMPIVAFTVLGLLLQHYVLRGRRFTVIGGKPAKRQRIDIGWRRWILFAYSWLIILVTAILPIMVLLATSLLTRWGRDFEWQNLTLYNYATFADTSTFVPRALVNSLLVSAGTACLAVAIAVVIAWIVERTRAPGRGFLTLTSTVTFAFPGIALAIGFVFGYSGAPFFLYGTLWLFLIAFTAQRFPYAFLFLRNGIKQLSPELEEAGRVAGASWIRSIADILAPLMRRELLGAWIMVFAVTIRELSMAILLYVPGTETLPVAIFSFVDDGTFELAAALSVVLVAISILSVLLAQKLAGRGATEF